ncbi:MAG: hypothetical protein PHR51_00990 [Patescibacteria group bacterium]|nr:hypothetical protein [Patescibacteria group bacterium]
MKKRREQLQVITWVERLAPFTMALAFCLVLWPVVVVIGIVVAFCFLPLVPKEHIVAGWLCWFGLTVLAEYLLATMGIYLALAKQDRKMRRGERK